MSEFDGTLVAEYSYRGPPSKRKKTCHPCAVAVCDNPPDAIYHQVPKGPQELVRKWAEACGRTDDRFERCGWLRVCSTHFTEDDYERDLRGELLGLPAKKKLKETAVPHVKIGKDERPKALSSREERMRAKQEREKRKQLVEKLIAEHKSSTQKGTQEVCTVEAEEERRRRNEAKKLLKREKRERERPTREMTDAEALEISKKILKHTIPLEFPAKYIHPSRLPPKVFKGVVKTGLEDDDGDEVEETLQVICKSVSDIPRNLCITQIRTQDKWIQVSTGEDQWKGEIKKLKRDALKKDELIAKLKERNNELRCDRLLLNSRTHRREVAIMELKDRTSLTDGEIAHLMRGTRGKGGVRWGLNDVVRAMVLKSFSHKAYRFMYRNSPLPMPGETTLAEWAKEIKKDPDMLQRALRLLEDEQADDGDIVREQFNKAVNGALSAAAVIEGEEMKDEDCDDAEDEDSVFDTDDEFPLDLL